MSDAISPSISFPGPASLGRGLVLLPDDPVPSVAATWPTLHLDRAVLAAPTEALNQLDHWWRHRVASVVVLEVPFGDLRAPESTDIEPYTLNPAFEFRRERLHFLTWINRYDGRGGSVRWHHGERARKEGAHVCLETDLGDVRLDDTPVWIDGGPRGWRDDGLTVVHVESVWSGQPGVDRSTGPESDLAPDQLAAVAHRVGPARIIAPAGSGKTRVLTERMRHLLIDRRWNQDSVTALAYNRRAAEEMRDRLADATSTHIRTLHAFGYEILGRAHRGRPRLIGERDVRRILDRLAPIRPRANEDVHAPYIEALSEVRTALRAPDLIEAERDDVPGFGDLFGLYRAELARSGTIDHDEQIYGAVEVLLDDSQVRAWAQSRCRHLLVDEFQDLSPAHLLLVRLLSAPGYDVFGVGDDDQVIYGYAGATPEFLIDYHRYFPGADHYQLEVNYRCPAPVVSAATTLLTHNERRVGKTIRPASVANSGLETIRASEVDMGDQLVQVVTDLVERFGSESVAVLTRVNVGLLVPQVSLAEAGIPVPSVLDEALLARSGVRAALAWLRLGSSVAHQEPMAGADLSEAIRRPPRSLSPGVRSALGNGSWTIEKLASFADGSTDTRTRDRLGDLVADIADLAKAIADGAAVAEQLTIIRDGIGLGSVLDRLDNSRARPTGGHSDDLDALIVLAHTHPEVEAFEPWLRSTLERHHHPASPITLSTVHRVKGLEWPHVVVWDASIGLMPHKLATDVEEERRIFHVAITRCSESVTVIARSASASPFVGQMYREAEPAPPDPAGAKARPDTAEATIGMDVTWQGYRAVVVALEAEAAVVKVGAASKMRIKFGETVVASGRRVQLGAPSGPTVDEALLDRLREWRRTRAAADGVPPYVVAHDAHLRSIAAQRPSSLDELALCDGIGPARLDRYGDDILTVLS